MSSTAAACHGWLFTFKEIRTKLNEKFSLSVALDTCGQWLPYWTAEKSAFLPSQQLNNAGLRETIPTRQHESDHLEGSGTCNLRKPKAPGKSF